MVNLLLCGALCAGGCALCVGIYCLTVLSRHAPEGEGGFLMRVVRRRWRSEDGYIKGRPVTSLVIILVVVAVMLFLYIGASGGA